jgi:hypothetical protein
VGSNHDRPEPGFTSLVRALYKGDFLGLSDAGEEVESLLSHPGWTRVSAVLEADMRGLDERLDGQLLATRSDYARLTGRRHGLRAMTEAARAIVSEAARQREEQQRKHERTAGPVLEA